MQAQQNRLFRGQLLTIVLMVFGYSGYYLCRSDFSVALPMIADELGRYGFSSEMALIRLGAIASLGVAAYALGKFPAGAMAAYMGGRFNFLAGMAASVFFTLLFALVGGSPLFTLAWPGDRFAQSWGWAGMLNVSSHWFSYRAYGTVVGILSLSFLFRDAGSRAMDLGGKRGSATASDIIDGIGYLGGILAGDTIARFRHLWMARRVHYACSGHLGIYNCRIPSPPVLTNYKLFSSEWAGTILPQLKRNSAPQPG